MDAEQFQKIVLANTQAKEKSGTRKYDEESFAQRVLSSSSTPSTPSSAATLKLDVAASMIHDLLVEMSHSWTQGFDFFRMFFGYLFPSLNHISRISLLHHVTSTLAQRPTLLAYVSHREWFRHLCVVVPVVYDIVILGELGQLMKTIGSFSLSQLEMKWLLRLLDSNDKLRPPWWTMALEVLQHVLQPRSAPDSFFTFFSKEGGFTVPMHEREVSYGHGYTFSAWINIESLPKHHQPCLYSFVSDNGEGFECFFIANTLTFRTRGKKLVTQKMSYKFQTNKWYFIAITHTYRLLWSSELALYVDGNLIETAPLVYPKPDSDKHPLTRCHVGNSHTLSQGFLGQMGTITFFGEALSGSEVHTLYSLGPNQVAVTNPATTDVTVGFDGNEFLFRGRHSAKIVWCYNPKADEGLLVQDVATSSMAHSATVLDGCRIIITTSPARALLCSGGLASLLPLVYQLHHGFMDTHPFAPDSIPKESLSLYHKVHSQLADPSHVFFIISTVLHHYPTHFRNFHRMDGFAMLSLLLQSYQEGTSYSFLSSSFSDEAVKAVLRLLDVVKEDPIIKHRLMETLILGSFAFWSRMPVVSQASFLLGLSPELQLESVGIIPLVEILQNYYWLDNTHPSPVPRVRENQMTTSEIKQLRMHILHIIRGLARPHAISGRLVCNEAEVKRIAQYLRECSPMEIEDVLAAVAEILPSNDPSHPNFDQDYHALTIIPAPAEKIFPSSLSYLWGMQALNQPPHQSVGTHQFNRSFLLVAENKWKRASRSRECILNGLCIKCVTGMHEPDNEEHDTFWKVDRFEGPCRMRRKLKINYAGSKYRVLIKSKVGALPPSEARSRDLMLWELSLPPPLDEDIVDENADLLSEFEMLEDGSSNSGSMSKRLSLRAPIPPLLLEQQQNEKNQFLEVSGMASSSSPAKHHHRRTPNLSIGRSFSTPTISNSSFRKNHLSPNKDKEKEKDKPLLAMDVQLVTVLGARKGKFRITNSYMDFIAYPQSESNLEAPAAYRDLVKSPNPRSPYLDDRARSPIPDSDNDEKEVSVRPRLSVSQTMPNLDAPDGHEFSEEKWTQPSEKDYFLWNLDELTEVHRTRYILRWVSLEFFFTNKKSYFIAFPSEDDVKAVYNKIISLHPSNLTVKWGSSLPKKILKSTKLTDKWRRRKISNFEYLMALNSVAGRSFNDLSQYPVFPHVLADYTSAELDLGREGTFRDLTKPMGALHPGRLAQLKDRMQVLSQSNDHTSNDDEGSGPPVIPPFLYGSHYSSPGAVTYYLIRLEPFGRLHLKLQSGVWDHTARLFSDLGKSWDSVAGINPADVKELTPEFFYMPEFLVNSNEFQLGLPGKGDVGLPPWAKEDPDLFIAKQREALESEYVSMNIHHWIDLIFGYKQRGPEAEKADNIFYHLTYEGMVNLDAIEDPMVRKSTELQILDFGQCPAQLMKKPHPQRMTLEELAKPTTRQLVLHTFSALLPPTLANLNKSNHPAIYCYRRPTEHGATLPLVHIGIPPTKKKGASGNVVLVYRDGVVGIHQYETKEDSNKDPVLTWALDKNVRARQFDSLLRSTSIVCIDNCFVLTADGKTLLSCASWDYVFKCSTVNNGKVQRVYRGLHSGMITCLALASDGKTFATGSQDCSILVWDDIETLIRDPTTPPRHAIHTHSGAVSCIDINPDWDMIVSGSHDKYVSIHSLRTGKYVRSMPHAGTVEMVKVSTKSQVLVSFCSCSRLYVHTLNGKLLHYIETEKIFDMKLTSYNYLVTGGMRGVKIYQLPGLEVVHEFRSATTIRTIAFVSRERFLLVGLEDGMMVIIRFDESQWRT